MCPPAYLGSPGKVSYAHPTSSGHIHENRHIRALSVNTQETGLMKKLFPLMRVLHCSVLIQLTPKPHWAKQIHLQEPRPEGLGGTCCGSPDPWITAINL